MTNLIDRIREKWNTRNVGAARRMWNTQYAIGFGSSLKTPENQQHYLMLAEFMAEAKQNKRILDVCCGEGLLLDFVRRWGYQAYLGFDFSEVALRSASGREDAKTSFVNARAESFVPDGLFDSIVFNECLYYLAQPLQVIRRYQRYLAPDGVMLVSLFTKTERIKGLAVDISKNFKVIRTGSVVNQAGRWECCVLAPGSASHRG